MVEDLFASDQVDIAQFVASLRRSCARQGLPLSASTAIDLHEAYRSLPGIGPRALYFASRALCVHRPEDLAPFDLAFSVLLGAKSAGRDAKTDVSTLETLGDGFGAPEVDSGEDSAAGLAVYSRHERLQDRDIAKCSIPELEMIDSVLDGVSRRHARVLRRRTRVSAKISRTLDLRRSIGRARSTDGDLIELVFRSRRESARRVVFLVDISGSMDRYVPALLRLIHGISQGELRVEIFALGTRLTRLSRTLAVASVDEALAAMRALVRDWSGGTRLGESLSHFNDHFGVRGLARGATVVIISDGLDRGEPETLGRQMHRLRLVARQVIWVNPLKAADRYEPLARGMAAALPSVDHFLSGHSLSSLVELVDLLYRPVAPPPLVRRS